MASAASAPSVGAGPQPTYWPSRTRAWTCPRSPRRSRSAAREDRPADHVRGVRRRHAAGAAVRRDQHGHGVRVRPDRVRDLGDLRDRQAPVIDEADRLYGLSLEDFVAERDALAKELRRDGRRAEADEVKALR